MTLDAVQETFMAGANQDGADNWVRRGLALVFEAHVRSMLAFAHCNGRYSPTSSEGRVVTQEDEDYAARTIAAMIAGDGGAHDGG